MALVMESEQYLWFLVAVGIACVVLGVMVACAAPPVDPSRTSYFQALMRRWHA